MLLARRTSLMAGRQGQDQMKLSDNMTGAALMVASMACFTINDALMKFLSGEYPLFQLIFMRAVITTTCICFMAWWTGAMFYHAPRREWGLIGLRVVGEASSTYFFLTALVHMPIANLTAIMQALPLVISLAALLLFREPVGFRRLSAILVGFVGVVLIVRPGAADFNMFSIYALIAVACVTLRDLATRRLSRQTPSMFVTMLTSVSLFICFGLASLGDRWVALDLRSAGIISGAAIFVIGGYISAIMVMRVGEISFVSPFRYTGLVWALVLGWLVFGEWPASLTLLGAAIVAGSGVFMLYREAQLGKRRFSAHGPRPR